MVLRVEVKEDAPITDPTAETPAVPYEFPNIAKERVLLHLAEREPGRWMGCP